MKNIFHIKRNDTSPAIEMALSTKAGPVDLTGASVYFHMANVVSAAAVIVDAAQGIVRYNWGVGDTDTEGYHLIEWEVVYSDGKKETFPNDGYSTVKITADIGEPI